MNPKLVELIVECWTDMLRRPTYDQMGQSGSLEQKRESGLTSMMAQLLRPTITEKQLGLFGESLKRRLMEAGEEYVCRWGLHCDYGPCGALRDSADEAGIPDDAFPWKTNMQIKTGCVEVSMGYAAPWVTYKVENDDEQAGS